MTEFSVDLQVLRDAVSGIQKSVSDMRAIASKASNSACDMPKNAFTLDNDGVVNTYQGARQDVLDFLNTMESGLNGMADTLSQVVARYQHTDAGNASTVNSINAQLEG